MAEAVRTLIQPTRERAIDRVSFAMENKGFRVFFQTLKTDHQSGVIQAEIMVIAPTKDIVEPFILVDPGEALVAMECDGIHLYLLTRRDYSPESKLGIDKIYIHDVNTAEEICSYMVEQRVQMRETITLAVGETFVYVLDGVDWTVNVYKTDGSLISAVALRKLVHQDSSVCLRSSSSDDFILLESNLRLQAISTADSSVLWTFDMPKKGVFKSYFGYGMFVEINDMTVSILDMQNGKWNHSRDSVPT